MTLTDAQIAKVATDHGFKVLERIATQLRATGQADVAGRVDFVSMIFRSALSAQPAKPASPEDQAIYQAIADNYHAKPAISEERVIELAKQAGLLSWTNRETLTKFAALLAAEGRGK